MNTIKYSIYTSLNKEVLIAMVSGFPFHSFVELENGIEAYMDGKHFAENIQISILNFLNENGFSFEMEELPFENWNKKWEENFEPVVVDDFCCVRADFHKAEHKTEFDLIINPKMAFGTGHHETTRVVISMMRSIDFAGKRVLDFGAGTGVLAILAGKMGAREILAIDNDPLAVENALENVIANHSEVVSVQLGSAENFSGVFFDVIIANINLNVLTDEVFHIREKLHPRGILLLSGVMEIHRKILLETYENAGFRVEEVKVSGEWLGVKCVLNQSDTIISG